MMQNEQRESAPVLAAKALDKELGTGSSSGAAPTAVNDLTAIVKKKKKPVEEGNGEEVPSAAKRKAEDEVPDASSEKKAKLNTETTQA